MEYGLCIYFRDSKVDHQISKILSAMPLGYIIWRHGTKHNKIQLNNTQHNDIQHNDNKHNHTTIMLNFIMSSITFYSLLCCVLLCWVSLYWVSLYWLSWRQLFTQLPSLTTPEVDWPIVLFGNTPNIHGGCIDKQCVSNHIKMSKIGAIFRSFFGWAKLARGSQ